MVNRDFLLLLILSLIVINNCCSPTLSKESSKEEADLDEDLSILLGDEEAPVSNVSPSSVPLQFDEDDEDLESDEGLDDSDADHEQYSSSSSSQPVVDEKDVVVLKERNFSDFVKKNEYAMVEFYAPWCGHCVSLAPEYAAAATELKGEVAFGKVDVTEENELAQKYEVEGLPTVLFFMDGVHRPYTGQRNKDGIVTWVKKKTGPGVHNITTTENAEQILNTEDRIIVGFLDSLVGPESGVLSAVSKLDDDVNFYQTAIPEVAKLFQIDPKAKRPALVLLKKEAEKLSHFNGQFTKSAIANFVIANKLPLVTTFSKESAPLIFSSPITKQILFFATSHDSVKVLPVAEEASKFFKGKLVFIYVEMDDEEVGRPVSEYFGASGDGPKVMAYSGHDDGRKYIFEGEVTFDSIKAFGKDFLGDKLMPFYKSAPIPETNDGDVKIVVKDNFDEIVLDESKDVFLEIYAPWCKHCQELESTFNKLAKHLHDIGSIVIAKMDGTTNEHPRLKIDGFPILLFFPAGNKTSDPILVDTDRTVVALYKFLKKHASIPFKLQKLDSAQEADVSKNKESSTDDVKDEL